MVLPVRVAPFAEGREGEEAEDPADPIHGGRESTKEPWAQSWNRMKNRTMRAPAGNAEQQGRPCRGPPADGQVHE